jgi:hypothetical protein
LRAHSAPARTYSKYSHSKYSHRCIATVRTAVVVVVVVVALAGLWAHSRPARYWLALSVELARPPHHLSPPHRLTTSPPHHLTTSPPHHLTTPLPISLAYHLTTPLPISLAYRVVGDLQRVLEQEARHPEGAPRDGDEGRAAVVVAEEACVEGGGHQDHLGTC